MNTLVGRYHFYKLPEAERKAMVGVPFQESMEHRRKPGSKSWKNKTLYFPVDLDPDEWNYNQPQGLIFVTEISPNDGMENWFRVGVCSPDDLDLDLDFDSPDSPQHREQAVEFLSDPTNMQGVFYADVLEFIQELTGAGTRS